MGRIPPHGRSHSEVFASAFVICACVAIPSTGSAQDLPPPVFGPSDEMARDGDRFALPDEQADVRAAQGFQSGSWTFKPSMEFGGLADTNVRAQASGTRDVAVVMKPRLDLEWRRGDTKLVAYGYASFSRYAKLETENTEQVALGGELEHRFAPTVVLRVRAETANLAEDRNAVFAASQSRTPVEYDRNFANATLAISPGRFAIVPGFEIDRIGYKDNQLAISPGTLLPQGSRSFLRMEPSLSVGYAISEATTVYAGGTYNKRIYDYRLPFDRDSTGYAVFGGIRFQPSPLTRLNLAIGYIRQDYHGAIRDPQGLYARASFDWTPTRTTLVNATLQRDVSETGNLFAGGSISTRASVGVTKQVLRTLTFTGRAEWRRFDLPQLKAKEERTRFSAGLQSRMTRNIELFANADLIVGRGDPAAIPFHYEGLRATIGIRIRP